MCYSIVLESGQRAVDQPDLTGNISDANLREGGCYNKAAHPIQSLISSTATSARHAWSLRIRTERYICTAKGVQDEIAPRISFRDAVSILTITSEAEV